MAEVLEIRNECDLFAVMQELEDGAWYNKSQIQFVDWPSFQIRLKGQDFNGGIPTRVMQPLMELQKTIDRAYSRAIYGRPKRLSALEKARTELTVYVEEGSSFFSAEITETLNTIIKEAAGKMTGPQIVGTIIGVAAIAGTAYVSAEYINSETAQKEIDYKISLSQEETKRYALMADLAQKNAEVNAQMADTINAQSMMMKQLKSEDELYIGGKYIVDGQTYKRISKAPRNNKVYSRLDGNYKILSVISGGIDDGYRVKVKNIADGHELYVQIPQGTLQLDKQKELQAGEWDKKPVKMQINIAKVGDKIVEATLIDAGLTLPFDR